MAKYTLVEDKELFDRLNRELIKVITQSKNKINYKLIDYQDFIPEMYGCPKDTYRLLRYQSSKVAYGGNLYVYRYLTLVRSGESLSEAFRFGEDWYLFEYELEELKLLKYDG